MKKKGDIAYDFDLLGNTYAYTKKELFSDRDTVFEMHYDCIFDFKRICPDIKVIYLLPRDLNIATEKLKERHLKPEVEKARIQEINEHFEKYNNDENLRKMFDYEIYNDYDEKSKNEVIDLIKKINSKK